MHIRRDRPLFRLDGYELLIQSEACLLIQPLSTVIYALDRLSDIADCTAVVVGLGPIGLLATWLLDKYGASKIVGVAPIAGRRGAAHYVGAAQTFETIVDLGIDWSGIETLADLRPGSVRRAQQPGIEQAK